MRLRSGRSQRECARRIAGIQMCLGWVKPSKDTCLHDRAGQNPRMKTPPQKRQWLLPLFCVFVFHKSAENALAADTPALTPVHPALSLPAPGPTNDAPYSPQPILQGGLVVALYPADSPLLNHDRVREAEQYNMSKAVPGRINSIVNVHNPSIEVHMVEGGINTGATVILAAGGGHNTLNVGSESADFVPYFYNYGVNTVILRNRLRRDG